MKNSPWIKGRINWFDDASGRGSIISDDGIWYRIHEFTKGKRAAWLTGTRIKFRLALSSCHPIVEAVRLSK